MFSTVKKLGFDFRPHVKTHKTVEGTLLELGDGTDFCTKRIVISTLAEAWNLLPLCKSGRIEDILFSMPVVQSRIDELASLSRNVKHLRLMVDNEEQLDSLIRYNEEQKYLPKWSLFVKINMGSDRAGFELESPELRKALKRILSSDSFELYGFYCHAGHSYGCHSIEEAEKVLLDEINSANSAAKIAREYSEFIEPVLSVGATPTAHAAYLYSSSQISEKVYGKIELHAGNFAFCDLQQVGTNCCKLEDVASFVLAEVVSAYPKRGKGPGEELINAGVLGLGRETGPIKGYGKVKFPAEYGKWIVGRVSQEHGVLTVDGDDTMIPVGTKVGIYPQHICIAAACYPWYYVVDGGDEVVDIWVPCRGW
ncbi:DEKNAAC104071 [Brettanomyces naardenensis]|uniref:D-serine dehydratase n=1 Tax=Brettanomyces naardenensis TaxID=13370 RepID=A0A448YQC3_BRENA|nr:DEKNAAC104071 [Brettanomyces naardenensis]